MSQTKIDLAKIHERQMAITGRRFCSSCQYSQPLEGGKLLVSKSGIKRWKCAHCLSKSLPPTRGK